MGKIIKIYNATPEDVIYNLILQIEEFVKLGLLPEGSKYSQDPKEIATLSDVSIAPNKPEIIHIGFEENPYYEWQIGNIQNPIEIPEDFESYINAQ